MRLFMATQLLILFTLSLIVAACTTPPLPASAPTTAPAPTAPSAVATLSEPDRVATRVEEELAVAQTLTAVAKTSETSAPIAATSTIISTQTRAPIPTNSSTPLDFDWKVESSGVNPDNPGEWQAILVVTPRGGNGKYSYFHDGLPVAGPRFSVVWRACHGKPGSIWVSDGTGQLVKKDYFIDSQYCNATPISPPPVTPTPTAIAPPPVQPTPTL